MYNPKLFDASTIARTASLSETLLRNIVAEPGTLLNRIHKVLDNEEQRLREVQQKAFQETSLRKLRTVRRRAVVAPADGEANCDA
jgi:hypothetical protein